MKKIDKKAQQNEEVKEQILEFKKNNNKQFLN